VTTPKEYALCGCPLAGRHEEHAREGASLREALAAAMEERDEARRERDEARTTPGAEETERLVDALMETATDNASCPEEPDGECAAEHLADLNASRAAPTAAVRCNGRCHCHAGPDGIMHPPCCEECAPAAAGTDPLAMAEQAIRSIVKIARAEPTGSVLDTIYSIGRDYFDAKRASLAAPSAAQGGHHDGT